MREGATRGWTVALALGLFSCGCQGPGGEARDLLLRVASGDPGESAPAFVAVLAFPEGGIEKISCPDSPREGSGVACTDDGLRILDAPPSLAVTVKAMGHGFATVELSLSELADNERGEAELEIALAKLEPFEQNQDYTGGFEREGGLELFRSMAWSMDTELGLAEAVKFYIDGLPDEPRVIFQNTLRHPIHYDFARTVLKKAVSLSDFEARTYHGPDREAMAGTVVRYPSVRAASSFLGQEARAPIAVTFFPSDDLTAKQALVAHRLIEERIGFAALSDGTDRVVYLPAGEAQEGDLARAPALFGRVDAAWMVRGELFGGVSLQILNPGLAYGTLKLLSPEQLEVTPVSFTDVLVLTRLPNTLPVVGGTITEEMQTPLAHVNVAARTRGTPNIALPGASGQEPVASLIGKLVRFEVAQGSFSLREADLAEAQQFWESRRGESLLPVFDDQRQGLPGFEELGFEDSLSVGVKAANLAELSRLLGERAPTGFAIPFHYYDRFMQGSAVTAELCSAALSDCLAEGRKQDICDKAHGLCLPPAGEPESLWGYAERIQRDATFQQDSELREAALDGIQYHIRHLQPDPDFAAALDARVAEVFGQAKVRLRSSTNTEDLPDFSGAGLYDSVSAYASGADAASAEVRKVWASVWSFSAFEERAFWQIDHRAVRMGVAVNQAFPDEAANGVLVTSNLADPLVAGMYVNLQLGEAPVTNPENGELPEIFSIIPAPASGIQVVRMVYSSLSPGQAILSNQEIEDLYDAASQVQEHFASLYQKSPELLALELEFKFHGPERALFIKQARPFVR